MWDSVHAHMFYKEECFQAKAAQHKVAKGIPIRAQIETYSSHQSLSLFFQARKHLSLRKVSNKVPHEPDTYIRECMVFQRHTSQMHWFPNCSSSVFV